MKKTILMALVVLAAAALIYAAGTSINGTRTILGDLTVTGICTGCSSPSGTILAPVAIGSITSAGTAGRFYPTFTDSLLSARDSGSVWNYYWGGVGPITRVPSSAGYTLVNSPVINVQNGGWLVTGASAGSSNLRFAYKAYPVASFTYTIGFIPTGLSESFNFGGLAVSDGTKLISVGVSTDSGQQGNRLYIGAVRWDTLSTGSFSAVEGTQYNAPVGGPIFITLSDDLSATFSCYWSNDINNLQQNTIFSRARTTYLTPTRVGVVISSNTSASVGASMLILHTVGTGGLTP
jgi:hypothetical protein